MKFGLLCVIVLFSACTGPENRRNEHPPYFDLSRYFNEEAERLTKANVMVDKTVLVNGRSAQKQLMIKNWKKEFESFISSDINKASWRGMFNVQNLAEVTVYATENDKIPVKKLAVTRTNGKVTAIQLFIRNRNDLYTSADTLSYFPDSLYHLIKTQKIRLMKGNRYEVAGKLTIEHGL